MNRLGQELSPYLKQHAHNPVDWYPWGEEALARAKAEDKPILLSIGYSACHWCHVMERESFDDAEIAASMNELYVSVKVDREERPDLDQIYQMVVQLMGRSGGWPLTVFLTPKLEPFFGGTYFPPVERYGMPGFPTVLRAVADAYRNRRDQVERSAQELTRAIGEVTSPRGAPGADLPADAVGRAATLLARRFDEDEGGFGSAPKFPNTMALDVMLRAWRGHADAVSLGRVRKALDAMRAGGIWDHLGGGFHRYSVDAKWRVPHFEKMLYDNALLLRVYVDAWRATGEARYAATARAIVTYVLREMHAPDGGFFSTQDADSEGEEGKFFAWSPEQLVEVLGEEDARIAALHWGVAPGGNFEHGTTVLHDAREAAVIAKQLEKPEDEVRAAIERAREKLWTVREQRPKPFRDETVIASWNGLMIGALADAGGALHEPAHVGAAAGALRFLRERMWDADRRVLRRLYKDGVSKGDGFLEDYGDVASAAVDVYENDLDPEALAFARAVADAALAQFWDDAQGGFFFAPAGATDLIVRAKDAYDDATPSGTSSMCHALLRLAAHTGEARYAERAETVLRALGPEAVTHPMGFGHLLGAVDRYLKGATEVVIVAGDGDGDADAAARELFAAARRAYEPNRVLARVDPAAPADAAGIASVLGGKRQVDGRATAYVCRERACSAPVTSAEALAALLGART